MRKIFETWICRIVALAAMALFPFVPVGAIDIHYEPMVGFAHFLYGISEAFPPASVFNRKWLDWKGFLNSDVESDLDDLRKSFLAGVASSANEHAFECRFYKMAENCPDIEVFLDRWTKEVFPINAQQKKILKKLHDLFKRVANPPADLFAAEEKRIRNSPEMKVFKEGLERVRRTFGNGTESNTDSFRISLIPVRVTPEDLAEARRRGSHSLFGRNFDAMQVVEMILIPEVPELAKRQLSHILAVGLHELTHFYYHKGKKSSACSEILRADRDPWGFLVSRYLNEAVATAVGNGWFNSRIGIDDPQWYANPIINRFAHSLLPLIRKTFQHGKPISTDFFWEARRIFSRTFPFPERQSEFAFLRFRWHGSKDFKILFQEKLKSHLPTFEEIPSKRVSSESHPEAETMKNGITDIFVLGPKESLAKSPMMNDLASRVESYRKWLPSFMISRCDRDRLHWRLIFVVQNREDLDRLIDSVLARRWLVPLTVIREKEGGSKQPR